MANTYTQLFIHVVFATKGRILLPSERVDELCAYSSGILARRVQKALAVGGMPDHVHAFFSMDPSHALSDVVRDLKAGSSKYVNDNRWLPGRFAWQAGYGAFSYSRSQVGAVCRYIQNQREHHRTRSFRQEYVTMLEAAGVDFDDRYVVDGM